MKKKNLPIPLLVLILVASACTSSPSIPANDQGEIIGMANPASVYCEEQGGKLDMRNNADGTYGVCIFPDGSECEEWAYFRGECSPGDSLEAADNESFSMLVTALYGHVISSNTAVPAESILVLSPEGSGSVFLTGENGEIEEQILAIQDKSEPANKANFWGRLDCPNLNECLLTVTSMRVDGPGDFLQEPIEAWEGVIYSGPPGPRSGGDDYFALLGKLPFQYGIDGADESLQQQLANLRDSGQAVRIWGTLHAGRMDWNAVQIIVTQIELIDANPSEIPAAPAW